ncbi:hybrid sensor histidine kinase/response regulator transcription factor [Alkalitalea saponilacus]|nr:hybrid sensor histidine kinase/response regulator transcription factor [Alkalitalea saponilacus]
MIRKILMLIAVMPVVLFSQVSENYTWTRYTTEDGLSQNTVMSIHQDKKGYMWYATWDGLSRFDGYNFTTYKVRPGDNVFLTSSRIDRLLEDKYGYIWLWAYGKNVSWFDPSTEEFQNVPDYFRDVTQVREIVTLHNGVTWLITEEEGGARIITDPVTKEFRSNEYSKNSGLLQSNKIRKVFADSNGNEWILTDNGISVINNGGEDLSSYFHHSVYTGSNNFNIFYTASEFDDEIWFGANSGKVWRYVKNGSRFISLQVPSVSGIVSIHTISDHEYFLATASDGLFIHNTLTGNFAHYNGHLISGNQEEIIFDTYQDSFGDIWIQQSSNSVIQYNVENSEVVSHTVGSVTRDGIGGPDFMIHEDVNGTLWIHPQGGGVYYYDRIQNKLQPFFSQESSMLTFSDRLHSMYSDRQGNLWMSTRARGLEKFVFHSSQFQILEVNTKPQFISDNDVRAILEDSRGYMWVSTKAGKVALFNSESDLIGYLGPDGKLHADIVFSNANVYTILEDRHGNIWLGTKGKGLVKAHVSQQGAGISYDLVHFRNDPGNINSLSHDDIYHIHEDEKGRIWLATYGGGINLLNYTGDGGYEFINSNNSFNNYPITKCYSVRYITTCNNAKVWVGTTNGLVVFDNPDNAMDDINFRHFTYMPGDSLCLSNNDVHNILITSKGEVFLATFGGGLNELIDPVNRSDFRFKSYTKESGLQTDVLLSAVEDPNGRIWIATENGISQFDRETKDFRNFNKTDFSRALSFSEGSAQLASNGQIWFGTNNGVLRFHPDSISRSNFVPPIVLTEFRVLNKRISPGKGEVLKKHIDATHEIKLRHNQNIISFGFAALDMKYPEAVKYAAMLEGFENEWVFLDKQRLVNYTNLPSGDYKLRVRSTNSDGIWVDNEKSVSIFISPSFWVTTWAYLTYFTLFFIIAGLSVYVLFTIYRLRHRITMEQQVSEMKLDFFTNISHELRTPLTLISGPLEQILNDPSVKDKHKESLQVVERNSSRMLRLINQILDFVKISHNKMKMTVEMIPAGEFVNRVMDNFRLMAIDHQIEFTLNDQSGGDYIWADADKFEKIIFNLLSNAFKYISGGKYIKVRIESDVERMRIYVIDNGAGIVENKKSSLFNRFESSLVKGFSRVPSTGIGLSIVKELVELHKGQIQVENTESRGTTFILSLKKGLSHFGEDVEILDETDGTETALEQGLYSEKEATEGMTLDENNALPYLLLVEDNIEVRKFILSILKHDYNVIEAGDGEEGFEKAQKYQPDIIISDLMMPVKDGMELLRDIRDNINTSHIPFIMLTAKTNEESQLEGLSRGADDYITKPFSPAYLQSRVINLLDQRRKLQLLYQGKSTVAKSDLEPDMPEVTSLDEKFLSGLKALMEENMENSDLVVEDLVGEMALSRSVFFKKLKALTGLAPIEYIKEMRLKRAAQLISIGQHNMTQIAFMVGMNDSRYFSKCFKQKYGMTPSEYKVRMSNQ